MERNKERVREPSGVVSEPEGDRQETSLVVDWYFGRLVERIAGARPVSPDQLHVALSAIEREGRRRRPVIEGQGAVVPCPAAPGEVYQIPVELWDEFEESLEFSDEEGDAVRAVHLKMARSIGQLEPIDGTAPFVFCAAPPEPHTE